MPPVVAIRPTAGTSFALIDSRPVLFNETSQKIYQLDRLGAYIWCKLGESGEFDTVLDGLAGFGLDRAEVHKIMRQALQQWVDLALVDVDWELSADFVLHSRLARHLISVQASDGQLLERLAPLFCNAGPGTGEGDVAIEVMEFDDRILFRINKAGLCGCEKDGLAPAVKARLTEHVIRRDRASFALHAASLINGGGGLVLCGDPGAGKSTLALHLLEAGFQYGGDDVVLMTADGKGEGISFAPTVKPGSWEIVSRLRRELNHAIVHSRTDGVRVRYLPVTRVHDGPFSISWIIFLRRIEGVAARLTPLAQIESMKRVIAGSFATDGRLSRSAFAALTRTLARAKSFELTYSDAAGAQVLLMDLCNG